jgi:hypothetical protein
VKAIVFLALEVLLVRRWVPSISTTVQTERELCRVRLDTTVNQVSVLINL